MVGRQLNVAAARREKCNLLLSSIGYLESGSQADLRPLRAGQRTAALVTAAALTGPEGNLSTG